MRNPYHRLFGDSAKKDQRDPGRRDRDRVLYTYALRRLAGVTQVAGASEGQLFHNRLTHTIEVAQIARSIAEKLSDEQPRIARILGGIDPDVAEAAALAHDLGHPPFGHIAEQELDRLARKHGEPDGFEGNAQSFRIITRLAAHDYNYPGLNLCRATLNAVLKYPWLRAARRSAGKKWKKFGAYTVDRRALTFARGGEQSDRLAVEAAIMDYADAVAYSVHDLDDFFRAGLVSVEHLQHSEDEFEQFLARWVRSGKVRRAELTNIRKAGLRSLLEDTFYFTQPYRGGFEERAELRTRTSALIGGYVYGVRLQLPDASGGVLSVSPARLLELKFLQRIVWEFVISNPRLATQQHGQRHIIGRLFDIYLGAVKARDLDLVPALFRDEASTMKKARGKSRAPSRSEVRLTVDIIASFTDHQALLLFRRLTGVASGSIADLLEG